MLMRSLFGNIALFVAGIAVGVFLMQPSAAQTNSGPGLRLNHVGIFAKDYDASMRFYTQIVGLKEAFTIRDKDGKPTLTYLQINKENFLELAPAGDRPVGLSHVGIWPENLNATVAALRQHGLTVNDPRTGSTKTTITNATDPDGIRLELLDFLPDSLPRKAMDSWK
jgi:catechol 2,3-dioxygenase-like lactoylglutathione lyase family enzyme